MKTVRLLLFSLIILNGLNIIAQDFNPDIQTTKNLQYFCPLEKGFFAGDPMPFWHDNTFHVFWLTDYKHQGFGHQWAHMSTSDLKQWKHHPLAVPIDKPDVDAICTGSVIYVKNKYYAFYATRTRENGRREYISYSVSEDGVNFMKQIPREFITAPPQCESAHFRDPHLFYDKPAGLYYMLITTAFKEAEIDKARYCLIYYTSKNMQNWEFKGPFYFSGSDKGFAYPECADIFKWNDWYYLLFKVTGGTYYRMAKNINGPWIAPAEDNIGNDYALVFKTAKFKQNRRIAVGFAPHREGDKDDGAWQYGGNLVFRELKQNENGSLIAVRPPEMITAVDSQYLFSKDKISISSPEKVGYQNLKNIPVNARITCKVIPRGLNTSLGMLLRYSDTGHYELAIDAVANNVSLGSQTIDRVLNLDKPFTLDIMMKNEIIDVWVASKRFILNRCPEQKGTDLYFFVHNGEAIFQDIKIQQFSK